MISATGRKYNGFFCLVELHQTNKFKSFCRNRWYIINMYDMEVQGKFRCQINDASLQDFIIN